MISDLLLHIPPFAHQHLPRGIHAHHMQDWLCNVAPQYARILWHRTRCLRLGMIVFNPALVCLLEARLRRQISSMRAVGHPTTTYAGGCALTVAFPQGNRLSERR